MGLSEALEDARQKPTERAREVFDAFDAEREGELDLRQFVIGLSTFAKTGLEEKTRRRFKRSFTQHNYYITLYYVT